MPRMTTNRSLNKLEFKAHMSIHNKVEVPEGETHDSNHTRDRFGKNHRLQESDGSPRIRRRLQKAALCLVAVPLTATLTAVGAVWAEGLTSKPKDVNIRVESEPLGELMLDQKAPPPEEKFAFYTENDTSVGLNEDGDPNMSVRF